MRYQYVSVALINGPSLPNTGGVAVGDFNGDGKLDVAISQAGTGSTVGTIQVYLGNGNGTFQTPRSTSTYTDATVQPAKMLVGDFNGDGKLDLLVTQNNESGFEAAWPQVFFGNGDGTFTAGPTTCGDGDYGVVGAVGDLNADGMLDYIWLGGAGGGLGPMVCIATGDGNFKFSYAGFSNFSSNPAIGDFNNDGKLDFFSADSNGSTFLGNGDGTFQGAFPPFDYSEAVIGDVNHDGYLDLVLANGDIWRGNGDGTFTAATPLVKPSGADLALQDIQGNDQLDVVMMGSTSLLIYPGFTNGNYGPALSFPISSGAPSWANLGLGDFNNDGRVDFIVPGATSTQVLLQTRLGIAPLSLNYGTVPLGNSEVQNFVLTDVGYPAFAIQGIKVVGLAAGNYSVPAKQCLGILSQFAPCTLPVTFTPKAAGALNASLEIEYKDVGSPQLIPLSGTGTPVKLSPVSVNFGDQKVGTVSPPVKVTMYNLGTTALSITGITIAGGTDFAETNNCGSSLPARGTCVIKVTFTPNALGGQSGKLEVRFDAPGAEEQVRLSGNGT